MVGSPEGVWHRDSTRATETQPGASIKKIIRGAGFLGTRIAVLVDIGCILLHRIGRNTCSAASNMAGRVRYMRGKFCIFQEVVEMCS